MICDTQEVWLPKPRGKAAEETNPADTCIIDSQPLALWENKLLIKLLSPWSFVMAAIMHQGLSCCDGMDIEIYFLRGVLIGAERGRAPAEL